MNGEKGRKSLRDGLSGITRTPQTPFLSIRSALVPTKAYWMCFSRKRTCFSSRCGLEISSASMRAMYFPFACAMQVFSVAARPLFSECRMTRIRLSLFS